MLSYALTNIQVDMHTIYIVPPNKQRFMETRGTSHKIKNIGNITLYSNVRNNIITGSVHNILVSGYGNALLDNP